MWLAVILIKSQQKFQFWGTIPLPLHQWGVKFAVLLTDDTLKRATPLIAPLLSGVAGLSASSSSKEDRLNT